MRRNLALRIADTVRTAGAIAGALIRRGWTGDGEGSPRYVLNVPWNFYQVPVWKRSNGANSAVEACVSSISQTVAMLPVYHWRDLDNGGREKVAASPAARVLRKPNSYQTRADFVLNLLRCELFTGNGFAAAARDSSFRISALHLLRDAHPYIDRETGAIFYDTSPPATLGEDGFDAARFLPARDVLHIRLHTPRDPLQGETPLVAAALAVDIGNQIQQHEATFFSNMARPSGVLETDMQLKQEQINELRDRFTEHTTGQHAGGTPILAWGLKWKPLTIDSVDAQIIDAYNLSKVDIASVFRVPPIIIGVKETATYNNTEQLMRHWHATGLGFIIDHLELALTALFNLPPNEYIEFDIDYLLRSDFVARMDGLTKAVAGGLYSPNEARAREGLPAAKFGDEPRMQAQCVPLSAYFDQPKVAPSAPAAPSAPGAANSQTATQLPAPNDPPKTPAKALSGPAALDLFKVAYERRRAA